MKIANYLQLALLVTFALSTVPCPPAQGQTTTVAAASRLNLMPVPASVQLQPGRLPITSNFSVAIKTYADDRLRASIARMTRRLAGTNCIDFAPSISTFRSTRAPQRWWSNANAAATRFLRSAKTKVISLEITDKQARLVAPTVVGALRGLETFLQLLQGDRDGYYLPGVKIHDQPRFPWRGLLIDIARHYQPPEVLKRNLDAMAAVKLNVFHWHLTEDQGFRVESKKFPQAPFDGIGRSLLHSGSGARDHCLRS